MKNGELNPKELETKLDEAIKEADQLHELKTREAQSSGLMRDRLTEAKQVWVPVANHAETHPEGAVWIRDAIDVVDTLRPVIRNQMGVAIEASEGLQMAMGTATSLVSTGASYAHIIQPELTLPEYTPMTVSLDGQRESVCERLAMLDLVLGNVCWGVYEALYGTRADAERAALGEMRQTLDHLFGILAPDDDVRRSRFWKKKRGDKPNAVYRRERLKYAAYTRVSDAAQAANLVSLTTQTLNLYDELNKVHKRGALDRHAARQALSSGEQILTIWADSLGLQVRSE